MPQPCIVVVGGVAAGPAAAAQAARTDPDAHVILIESGPHVSYGACSIPHYLRGEVARADDLIQHTPAELEATRGMEVRVCTRAERFDAARRRLHLRDVATGQTSHLRADKLILATGARARLPGLEGERAPNVTPIRTLADGARLRRWIDAGVLGHVVVLGGGYVGTDVAYSLSERGVRATVLEPSGVLVPRIVGGALADVVTGAARAAGVAVRAERATGFRLDAAGRVVAVETDAGERVGCDAVVLALGIEVNQQVARSAGARLRDDGTVAVDGGGRTSAPGVWACGDAIAVPSAVTGDPLHRPLAWDAFQTARVAGTNAARTGRGRPARIEPSTGASAVAVFGVEAAGVGLRREQAHAAGLDVVEATITQDSRVGHHPQAAPTHVRLLAERSTGRLVGGELAGRDGAALRADVLVPLVKRGAPVDELARLDLIYTPSVAPLHDPLRVAARVLAEKRGTGR